MSRFGSNRTGFNYPYSCPDIDRSKDDVKEAIIQNIDYYIKGLIDEEKEDEYNKIAIVCADDIFSEFEDCFERVRKQNSDMRDSAEDQISILEDDIEEMRAEYDSLAQELEDKQDEIGRLLDEMDELKLSV